MARFIRATKTAGALPCPGHHQPVRPARPCERFWEQTFHPGVEITEAPTGFDNLTNGFDPQGPPFEKLNEDTVVPLRSFNDNRFIFEEVETDADGLGPTYNAQSCRECHQNVVTGGASQVDRASHRPPDRTARSSSRWADR